MTAVGTVRLARVNFVCAVCGEATHVLDERLGVDGYLSPNARRLLCLAGAGRSFDQAARDLLEFCGLRVCENLVNQTCVQEGPQMEQWQRQSPQTAEGFVRAAGDIEFSTDGTSVNTLGGWREMRVNVFAKRERGEPATPEQWDKRELPRPTVRVAFGSLENSDKLGPQWRVWAGRLGIKQCSQISLLADGAKWIWKEQEKNLPGSAGVLDIYHNGEHLYAAAKVLVGEGRPAAAWVDARRLTVLTGGGDALLAELGSERSRQRSPRKRAALDELTKYLGPHREHMDYRARLAEGRSIGSGMIEGACKNVVGRRLKQTGARWRDEHAEAMTSMCCTAYGDLWDAYWASKN